jgi:MFS family permease
VPAEAGVHALSGAPAAAGAPVGGVASASPVGPSRVAPFFAAAFLVDGAVNLTLVGVPYKALELGASALVLGLLPAVWSIVYIAGAVGLGRLSDRTPRLRLTRAGTVLAALACVLLAASPALPGLFAGIALLAVGLSMFWPSLQAALSEADRPERLRRNLGFFNLSWSSGKGLGFAAGGLLLAASGFPVLAGVSVALLLSVALFLGARSMRPAVSRASAVVNGAPSPDPEPVPAPPPGAAARADGGALHRPPASLRASFLTVAWIANGVAYGINATLGYHFPKYLDVLGIGAAHFGLFLGATYLSQTVTFLLLMRTTAWHYRAAPLAVLHVVLAAVLLLLPFLDRPALHLLLAPLVGGCLGLAYYSSIYYSLDAAARPGRNTGLHEAIIGSGVLLAPPLGGGLVLLTGRLESPYVLCAAASLVAIGAEILVLARARRGTSPFPGA